MNYAAIYEADCANGEGMRTSLFVSGCRDDCPGCFNEEAWDFNFGKPFTPAVQDYIVSTMTDEIAGLSILGGEPFEPENIRSLFILIKSVKKLGTHHTIWMYTGFTWEQLRARNSFWVDYAMKTIDVLVDGPFIQAERDISLKFRGSRNQRIIDTKRSLQEVRVVLWEGCKDGD